MKFFSDKLRPKGQNDQVFYCAINYLITKFGGIISAQIKGEEEAQKVKIPLD